MNLKDWIGEYFRGCTGMPHKVESYNLKLAIFDEIIDSVDAIKNNVIDYFNETYYIEYKVLDAEKIRIEESLKKGIISSYEYSNEYLLINGKRDMIINSFVSSTSQYFVVAYKNKLCSIKEKYRNDSYISLMRFDTWFDLKEAKELAKLASLQIKTSDNYVDSAKIAEICERYRRNIHMRKGR